MRIAVTLLVLLFSPLVLNANDNANDWYECMDYFAGEWESTLTSNGEQQMWVLAIAWSPTKRSQTLRVTVDGEPFEHGMYGYDPKSKTWMGTIYWANGRRSTEQYDPNAINALREKSGLSFGARAEGTELDGKTYTETGTVTVIDDDQFSMKWVSDSGTIDLGTFTRRRSKSRE